MFNRTHNTAWILAAAVLWVVGCEDERSPWDNIVAAIEEIILADEALGIAELDDGGAPDEEFGDITDSGLPRMLEDYYPSDTLRFRFGRRINSFAMSMNHESFGDTTIITTITHTVSGDFITVIRDTAGALVDSFSKEFSIDAVRKVKFVRIDNTKEERRNWKLAGLTPIVSTAGEKIALDSLTVTDIATGQVLYRFDADDILDTYLNRDNLPTFTMLDTLAVKLYVNNAGPVYDWESGEGAHLRFGRGRRRTDRLLHARRRMFDDGTHGDAVAYDDEFTRIWRVHPPGMGYPHRLFKMFVDVIDFETLFSSDEEAGYNSAFWGFPYVSTR